MKLRILAGLALFMLAGSASAASYTLASITYANQFTGATVYTVGGNLAGTCFSCGTGTAVTTGTSVALTDVNWTVNAFGQNYTIDFDATTNIGLLQTLVKAPGHTCVDTAGTTCAPASIISGFGGGTFYSGFGSDNSTVCANCSVATVLTGTGLTVSIRKALSEANPGFFQRYNLNYVNAPVPAAVWMLGSALGLLGFIRRRSAA